MRSADTEAALKFSSVAPLVAGVVHGALGALLWAAALFAVPSFAELFAEYGADLPASTEIIIGVGQTLARGVFLWLPLSAVVLAGDVFLTYKLSERRPRAAWILTFSLAALSIAVLVVGAASLYAPFFETTSPIR